MEIKRLTSEDFGYWRSQISDLLNESVKLNFPNLPVKESYGTDRCGEVYEYLKNGSAVVYIAVDKDRLKGWIWCHKINRMEQTRFHVAEIAVSRDCRKQGVGKSLLMTAENYAVESGCKGMDLLVTASNENAVRFYEGASYETERLLMKKIF